TSGLQSEGVIATLKHFPGKGGAALDSHFGMPVINHDRARLDEVELVPFRSGIEANAGLVMTGHFAIPGITEADDLPSTLSTAVLTGLLRKELGYQGAVITDAFDMGAISQGYGQIIDAIAAIRAGVDLLLLKDTLDGQDRLERALELAVKRGLIDPDRITSAQAATRRLRSTVAGRQPPGLDVVSGPHHRALAAEVAARSITLVRNDQNLLPIRLDSGARIAAIMPSPRDLTPADTSSYVRPGLAMALRAHHDAVDEFVVGHPPTNGEVADLTAHAARYDLLVIGTISASMDPAQADLVARLIETGIPAITVSLRTPYDITAYPATLTHICTYSILEPSTTALAAALFGRSPFTGKLPVRVSDRFPAGHGIDFGDEI
ncbi:MAG: glycoside hydrolase family 3 protein, partial [Acidimicrobiia bacterium]|nr:glycoside hydrolase family 3 protein [Acidimicrobiia bacterium]